MIRSLNFDKTVPVLTLKVGYYVLHHGAVGIARTFGRAGVSVYGIHEDRLAPAGLSRYTTGRFLWSTGDQDLYQEQLLAGLTEVAKQIGRQAVLIPTDDHAAIFVADHEELVRRHFLIPPQSPLLIRELTDKAALYSRCVELGVAVPAFTTVNCRDELEAFADEASFPVVAKRRAPFLLADGRRARSTQVISTRDELLQIDLPSPIVLQEYIPSAHAEDWLFHAYCDAHSECLVAFTGRKLHAYPPGAGETALGRMVRNPALEQEARLLMSKLGYSGVVSLDYRFDKTDKTYKLLDFNPRVGAIFSLFQTDADIDVVRALHLNLTGRTIPQGHPVEGRTVAVEGHELRWLWANLRSGHWAFRQWQFFWRPLPEPAWFAVDDPLPAVTATVRAIAQALHLSPARQWRYCGPRFLPGRSGRKRFSRAMSP